MCFPLSRKEIQCSKQLRNYREACEKSRDETALRTRHQTIKVRPVIMVQITKIKRKTLSSSKTKPTNPMAAISGCKANTYSAEPEGHMVFAKFITYFYTNINLATYIKNLAT